MTKPNAPSGEMRLFTKGRERLYINSTERVRFLRVVETLPLEQRVFCLILTYTGCRISEALELNPDCIDATHRSIAFRSLKKRDRLVMREVPVPRKLIHLLKELIGARQFEDGQTIWQDGHRGLNRSTAYRWVKSAMTQAVIEGPQACPKGLRHGFGVHAMRVGVQLNMLQKWMGHASMTTTAIYADATGPEEREIARRMWLEKPAPKRDGS